LILLAERKPRVRHRPSLYITPTAMSGLFCRLGIDAISTSELKCVKDLKACRFGLGMRTAIRK
jgi:hypothetical protein